MALNSTAHRARGLCSQVIPENCVAQLPVRTKTTSAEWIRGTSSGFATSHFRNLRPTRSGEIWVPRSASPEGHGTPKHHLPQWFCALVRMETALHCSSPIPLALKFIPKKALMDRMGRKLKVEQSQTPLSLCEDTMFARFTCSSAGIERLPSK